jgi:large subunit ribosomal protein L4
MLAAVNADGGCVFATKGIDQNAYKSGRNIPRTHVMNVADLNAWDVLRRKKLIFTRDAFAQFKASAAAKAKGE